MRGGGMGGPGGMGGRGGMRGPGGGFHRRPPMHGGWRMRPFFGWFPMRRRMGCLFPFMGIFLMILLGVASIGGGF